MFRILPEGTSHSDATQVLMPGVPPSRSRSTANSQSREQTLPVPLCIQELVLGDPSVDAEAPSANSLAASFDPAPSTLSPPGKGTPTSPRKMPTGWIWGTVVAALAVVGLDLASYYWLLPRASEPEPVSVGTTQTLPG